MTYQPKPVTAQSWVQDLKLPPGFSIEVFARARGARAIDFAPQLGVVFVSTRRDTIYAIPLSDDDGLRPTYPVLSGLKAANGIAWKDGYLYVGEQNRLTRYHVPAIDALAGQTPEVLFDGLPDKSWHGYRYMTFGADGALYMGVGAACNVCSLHGLEGTILKFTPGKWGQPEIAATGVRNTVGLDVNPQTGQIFFTDNGADGMGDDSPPDELNALEGLGAHYGFPWFGGGEDRTPQFKLLSPPQGTVKPQIKFQAHVAPLGVDFYEGDMFPEDYRHDAFVAQHGSWNRSIPVGYRIMRIRFNDAGQALGKEPFIEGWLRPNEDVWGRPVDVEDLPDGSLLISDDGAGLIYRVSYKKP
ncbi:PQQ-dependent sugar dehydrogenase [Magnetovibrio sp. PR-2]|uniref:PQQ-dependent sugar dehydrogenase n=1 Tax=Magnetovibrio sp. PR-2 TaxID=3120356 RepID=UPI002FCE3DDF